MRAFLFTAALVFWPLPMDALRSFYCSPEFMSIFVTVGAHEIVEIRSQQPTSSLHYYNNMNCTIFLAAPSSNDRVNLAFSAFNIEPLDTVMLYDGKNVVDGWPNPIGALAMVYTTSLTSTMKVQMITNSWRKSTGFVANAYITPSIQPGTTLSQSTLPDSLPSSTAPLSSFTSLSPSSSTNPSPPSSTNRSPSSSTSPSLSSSTNSSPSSSTNSLPSSSTNRSPSSSTSPSFSSSTNPSPSSSTGHLPADLSFSAPITKSSAEQQTRPSSTLYQTAPGSVPETGSFNSNASYNSSSNGTNSSSLLKLWTNTSSLPTECPTCSNVVNSTAPPATIYSIANTSAKTKSNRTSEISEVSSASSEVHYSIIPTTLVKSEDHFVIKYLSGSQIPAFQVSVPISISHADAPSRWINGDFSSMISKLAEILQCHNDRIQNVALQPYSRLQSQLQLLILAPCDMYELTASALTENLIEEMKNPYSALRKIEVLGFVPDPPVNITMQEVLVTVCANSTYAIGECPGNSAQLESVRGAQIRTSELVIWLAAGTILSVFLFVRYIRRRQKKQQWKDYNLKQLRGSQAINCDDSETFQKTQPLTKHRTNLSFALPTVNQHYQVKRTPYDEMQISLGLDEALDQGYMRKRQGSYQLPPEDGNLSAME